VHRPAKLPSSIQEATLMKRGDDLFAQGDLAGARLYYEMVAETGNAKAAFALGRTHDPLVHERLHVRGLPPDPEQAAAWYRRAVAAGSGDAEQQLKKLTDWLAGKSR
jgi:TPR repeat protein